MHPKVQGRGETVISRAGTPLPPTCEAVNPFASDTAIPSHLELTLCKAHKSMTHLYQVCTEQESFPNEDQKQSKRNYMSLLGRDVIAPSGLEEHNLNQLPPNSSMWI